MRVREEIAVLMDKISGIIRSYAISVNNIQAKMQFSKTYSQLFREHTLFLSGDCSIMIDFLDKNFPCFRDFGLKKSSLDELKKLHKNFSELSQKPRTARDTRQVNTQFIPQYITKIENLIKDQMLTLLPAYEQFPEFCKAFRF